MSNKNTLYSSVLSSLLILGFTACANSQEIASNGSWMLSVAGVLIGIFVAIKIIQHIPSLLGVILGIAVGFIICISFAALAETSAAYYIGLISMIVIGLVIIVSIIKR